MPVLTLFCSPGMLPLAVGYVEANEVEASAKDASSARRRNYSSGSSQICRGQDINLSAYHCRYFRIRPHEHSGIFVLGRVGTEDFSYLWRKLWKQLSFLADLCYNAALQIPDSDHQSFNVPFSSESTTEG